MKVSELLKLESILKDFSKEKIGIETAYNIAKFMRAIEDDSSFFKQKIREFLGDYCMKDKEGNALLNRQGNILLDKTKISKYIIEMQKINDLDIKVPELKIKYEDLSDLKIEPDILIALMPYIDK